MCCAALIGVFAIPAASAQSQSGFAYNGVVYVSYQASEYQQTPQGPQGVSAIRATGANYTAIVVTQYQQTYTSNTIAPETAGTPGYDSSKDPLSPTDDAVVAAIKNAQAQGLTVFLKPQVDSLDGVFRGQFAPADPAAWFASYETFILHYAQLASANGVGGLVIGTELASLSKVAYAAYWDNMISQMRASYPNLTLAYGANATSATDEFTTVSFWDQVDIIGVDGYFPLTNHADPTVPELVAAWTNNKNGLNIVAALKALQSKYNKPLIFTELGYVSAAGTNEAPYNSAAAGAAYDPTEQQNCYEAFFEVFSQQSSWMKGVFWWAWNVSPPGSNDLGYTPQNKPAGANTLPKWFGSTTPSFTLASSNSTVNVGGGLSINDTIAVTNLGGFTGAVALAATGLPAGVTASFSPGSAAGTQILALTAANSATIGPASVTITGTSGTLTAATTISLTVQSPNAQSISFVKPSAQTVGTPLTLSATASSGLAVAFTSDSLAVCTVNGTTASFLTVGTCTITASQAGNSTYAAAAPVAVSFQVSALPPAPVPSADEVIVSQLNWLDALTGYVQTSNNATGGSFAANTAGEVAVADTNSLLLINSLTGSATTLGAWSGASAVAVDSKNNLYIGSLYGAPEVIVKLPYTSAATNGGYAAFAAPTTSTPDCTAASSTECIISAVGSVYPSALAFDSNGNLFWVTSSSGATSGNSIYECTASCLSGSESPIQIFQEPTASTAPSSSSGQLLVGSIAIDPSGNIFFTDSSSYVNTATYSYTSFSSNLNELPVTNGVGYGGVTTGYAGAPSVLFSLTPSSVGPYNNEVDAVAINPTTGTVYFADQSDGVYAFPNDGHPIPAANGRPTSMYAVSLQGAKTLTTNASGDLFLAASSAALNTSGADTVGRISSGTVTVPSSSVNTMVSPSTTINPVTTFLNDASCTSMPSPLVTFAADASTTASATASTSGNCIPTLSGGAAFATSVSFTPLAGGSDSVGITATDQSNHTASVTVTGTGQAQVAAQAITFKNPGPQVVGSTVALSASASSGLVIAFTSETTSVCTVSGATATFLVAGTCTIDANQMGNASYSAAQQVQVSFMINPAPSFTLSSSLTTLAVTQGSSVAVMVSLSAISGFNGAVTLSVLGLPSRVTATFATNPTSSTSQVTFTAAGMAAVGSTTVTIVGVSGSLSSSATVKLSVTAPLSVSVTPGVSSLIITRGTTATDAISVAGSGGFTGNVSLTATVISSPQGAQNLPTLSFGSTGTVNVNGSGGGTATLSIFTTAPSVASLAFPTERRLVLQLATVALASWCFLGLSRRRRRALKVFVTLLSFSMLSTALFGCAGKSSSTPSTPISNPGTTVGTYVVTVTATSSTATTSSQIQLIVQ